jgi:FkbM family methyltransferase
MLAFDIGANRGEWTKAALDKGYEVVALEPGNIVKELVKNFIYDKRVKIVNLAASDKDFEQVEFYECVEDGLSSINKDWLTDESLPYAGKAYRTTSCTTITIDTLAKLYGEPSLIKIDVEGAEWSVLRGMTKRYGKLAFEWTLETLDDHQLQIEYLEKLGYERVRPQYIEHHCQEPKESYPIRYFNLDSWIRYSKTNWEEAGWEDSGLRPTADVGMLWFN